ncbi:MAG TPA: SDR family NAD(P)-dependent oxidoreductase, partial [Spirochaetia bacterium]|nr:SDR family NAD(P)-dependent oxidoreductase [Spirochaetia bacterium]
GIERSCLTKPALLDKMGAQAMNNNSKTKSSSFRDTYGPWAVVAGGSTGLGAAYVRELAARGVNVVAIARSADRLAELKEQCERDFGVQVRTIGLDLLSATAFDEVAAATSDIEVGLLVYNAAFPNAGGYLEKTVAQQRSVVTLNCMRPMELSHHFAAQMRGRGRGGIVLMSSLTAFNGSPYISNYGASKAFNLILGEGLGYELAKIGVNVTVCCAGVITTPNFEEGFSGKASLIEPPKMTPEEVARLALGALGRKNVIVPGSMNSFLSFIMRKIMSRRAAVRLMAKTVEDLSIEERQSEQEVP